MSAEDRQGQTSLSWACLKGRVAIAQYLLDRGAPIDHADKSGKTALDLATLNGNPALVQVRKINKIITKNASNLKMLNYDFFLISSY